MLEAHLRQASIALLKTAIQIAPPDSREWGQAMESELAYVEGPWAALMWALGGASVMARHAMAALFIPGRGGQGVDPDGIFAKRISLSKAALTCSAACMLGALLFFFAPPFRQAVQVSLEAWKEAVLPTQLRSQQRLIDMARRAEAQHDPEGLAFVAVRLCDYRECTRLANEAVQTDPAITWIYAALAVRRPGMTNADWAAKLKVFDPQNAFIWLIEAQSIRDAARGRLPQPSRRNPEAAVENNPRWLSAMAAAFASPKFDDYLDRLAGMDRRVEQRYRFDDPYEVLFGSQLSALVTEVNGFAPNVPTDDSQRFGNRLLSEGQEFEGHGERHKAADKYWEVARFGQLLEGHAHWFEHPDGIWLQSKAYQCLGALAQEEGNQNQAALFTYLAGKFGSPVFTPAPEHPEWVWGHDISMRNGAVFQIASLVMVVFSVLFISAAMVLWVARGPGNKPGKQTLKLAATTVTFASAVGVLLASATVYLTYRPYWYILQHAIQTGDSGQTRDLMTFLLAIRSLAMIEAALSTDFPIYLWAGVTLLCVLGLLIIFLRHIPGPPHAHAP